MAAVRNPRYLALQSSNLDQMESAFLNSDGLPHYGVAFGLGAESRVKNGICAERHFSSGICWGAFEGEHTKFVNARDHNTSCALEENRLCASQGLQAAPGPQGALTNNMSFYRSGAADAPVACSNRSYSTYGSCVNCPISGATVYACGQTQNNVWSAAPLTSCS